MQLAHTISLKTKFALAITILLWASAFVGIRAGLQGYSPGALALFRFLIASVCMGVICVGLPANRHKINFKDTWRLFLLGAVAIAGYHIALNYGELTVPSGIASFIISQSPVITTILAILFLGERLNLLGWTGMSISVAGVTLIMLAQTAKFSIEIGNLYVLIAAIAGSIYSVLQKPYLKKYHAIEVTAYVIWGCTIPLLFYAPALSKEIFLAPMTATVAIIYLGIFPAAIAHLAWSYVLATMPASRASNFMYFMPLLATLLGWLFLAEVPTWMALFGGLMALVGVWVLNESYRWKTKERILNNPLIEKS